MAKDGFFYENLLLLKEHTLNYDIFSDFFKNIGRLFQRTAADLLKHRSPYVALRTFGSVNVRPFSDRKERLGWYTATSS